MPLSKSFARSLAAGVALAAVIPTAQVAGASEVQRSEVSDADAPLIWSGKVADLVGTGAVVVHALPAAERMPEPGDGAPPTILGQATIGTNGVAEVRAAPGSWTKSAMSKDGRVRLMITASGDEGRQIGVSFVDVTWNADARQVVRGAAESTGAWEAVETDPDGLGKSRAASVDVPTSVVEMAASPPEVLRAVEASTTAKSPTAAAAAVGAPSGFYCTGSTSYEAAGQTWLTIGKYLVGNGAPKETGTFQRTTTTSSSVGAKVGASAGPFSVAGSVTASVATTNSAFGESEIQGDGTFRDARLLVKYNYRRYRHSSCWYSNSTPPSTPGLWFSVYSMQPHSWTGDVTFFAAGADPAAPTGTTRTLLVGQTIGRSSGVTTTVTSAFEATIGASVLSGGVQVSTSNSSGSTVTRKWKNPATSGPKYITGYGSPGGDPQMSGVFAVYGYA